MLVGKTTRLTDLFSRYIKFEIISEKIIVTYDKQPSSTKNTTLYVKRKHVPYFWSTRNKILSNYYHHVEFFWPRVGKR